MDSSGGLTPGFRTNGLNSALALLAVIGTYFKGAKIMHTLVVRYGLGAN